MEVYVPEWFVTFFMVSIAVIVIVMAVYIAALISFTGIPDTTPTWARFILGLKTFSEYGQ